MSTNAHNGYVALAKQVARQAKRQHLSIKRDEAIAILTDKDTREARIRELEKALSAMTKERDQHANDSAVYREALHAERAK